MVRTIMILCLLNVVTAICVTLGSLVVFIILLELRYFGILKLNVDVVFVVGVIVVVLCVVLVLIVVIRVVGVVVVCVGVDVVVDVFVVGIGVVDVVVVFAKR